MSLNVQFTANGHNYEYELYSKNSSHSKAVLHEHVTGYYQKTNTPKTLTVMKQIVFAKKIAGPSTEVMGTFHECVIEVMTLNVNSSFPIPQPPAPVAFPDNSFNLLGVNEEIFPVKVINSSQSGGRPPLNFNYQNTVDGYFEVIIAAGQQCEVQNLMHISSVNLDLGDVFLRINTNVH